MEVDIDFLATSEGIAACNTQLYLGSDAPDGACIEIGFDIEVVGFIEGTVDGKVERVSDGGTSHRRVTRCELYVDHGEEPHGIELSHRLEVIVVVIGLSGS